MPPNPHHFRADGTAKIGLGHLMRCVAIASYLPPHQPTSLVVREPGKAIKKFLNGKFDQMVVLRSSANADKFTRLLKPGELAILDGYHFNPAYQQAVLDAGAKLICIDDTALHPYLAHAVINHGGGLDPSEFQLAPYTKLYLGPKYAMLRLPFLEAAGQYRHFEKIESLFVALGGADPDNHTLSVLQAASQTPGLRTIHVVIGAANLHRIHLEQFARKHPDLNIRFHFSLSAEEMVALFQECQLAITTASTISYEAASVGIGLILIPTIDNQERIYQFMMAEQMAAGVRPEGDFTAELAGQIRTLLDSPDKANQMLARQRANFDGKSPERIRAIIDDLMQEA